MSCKDLACSLSLSDLGSDLLVTLSELLRCLSTLDLNGILNSLSCLVSFLLSKLNGLADIFCLEGVDKLVLLNDYFACLVVDDIFSCITAIETVVKGLDNVGVLVGNLCDLLNPCEVISTAVFLGNNDSLCNVNETSCKVT